MEYARSFLLSITSAALLCSISKLFFRKKSAVGAIVKLTCSLIMTMMLLNPIFDFQLPDINSGISYYKEEAQKAVDAGNSSYQNELRDGIKTQTEAYILKKACDLGVELEVTVALNQAFPPVPESVILSGPISAYNKSILQAYISDTISVPKEQQLWN